MKEEHQAFATQATWRYLKAAFWYDVNVPALGNVPANVLAVAAFSILGFGESAIWLAGLGLETSYLFAMTFNPRFQRLVNARMLQHSEKSAEEKRKALLEKLPVESQKRLAELETNCEHALEINRQSDDLLVVTNRDALARLEWAYLKLLVARNNLANMGAREPESELAKKVADLERDVREGKDSETLRQSKSATLGILRERLANVRRRQESIEEVDSDLARIEAQVQLIIENASIHGRNQTVSADIDLASSLFASNLFGDASVAIADLDREYGGSTRPVVRERS